MASDTRLNPVEEKFLCQVLRSFVDKNPPPAVPKSIQWDRFNWVLSVNRLVSIFHHIVGDENLRACGAPGPLVDLWQQRSERFVQRNRQATRAAVEMTGYLAEASIPCRVVRGVSLLYRAYGDEALRPMFDVDMAVPKDRAKDLVAHFSSAGRYSYTSSKNQVVCKVRGHEIEIHWHIIKRKFTSAFDFSPLFENSEILATEWGDLEVLSPENEFIGVITHHFLHHDMDRLLKTLDIALLCTRFDLDWDYIRDWAERARLSAVFHFTLSLVDHLLETDFHTRLKVPNSRQFTDHTFEPYLTKLFGRDTRRAWGRRLANSVAIADGASQKVQMVRRFERKQDIQKLLARPYDVRKAAHPPKADAPNIAASQPSP